MYKVFTRGNYFYIIDTVSGREYDAKAKDVKISKGSTTSDDFTFELVENWSETKLVDITDILKENGDAYTLAEFITFYEQSTGETSSAVKKDFFTEAAAGNVAGYSTMNAMGEREGIGTTVTGEDVWRGNDLSPAPTSDTVIPTPAEAGEQMTFVSESNADNGATATGVLTLRMEYLDATGAEQTEDITLNGTTGVNTVATDIRFVNDIYSLTVGSNGVAEGNIKVYKTGTVGLVYNMIAEGGNKSLVPHRMVPLGKSLVVTHWHATEAQNKRVVVRLRSTDMNGVLIPGVFCFKDTAYIKLDAISINSLFEKIPALSIIKVSAWGDQNDSECSCGWNGVLIDD